MLNLPFPDLLFIPFLVASSLCREELPLPLYRIVLGTDQPAAYQVGAQMELAFLWERQPSCSCPGETQRHLGPGVFLTLRCY